MGIFSTDTISLDSPFEDWYAITNELVGNVNSIRIIDIQAATAAGMQETLRAAGIVELGINAGAGITFADTGELTLGVGTTNIKARASTSDTYIIVQSNGDVKGVGATDMIPSQVDGDINFTGNVSFAGDLSFITTGTVSLEANSSFSDKNLELAVSFLDDLQFATTTNQSAGITTYLVDINTVGTTFADFDFASTGTYIGAGILASMSTGINEVKLRDFLFVDATDAFTEFTISGATSGGQYLLLTSSGTTVGRGLQSRVQERDSFANQTSPIDANAAGLIVVTSDPITPTGASQGEKRFTWLWNGTSADAAWFSTENLEVDTGKFVSTRKLRSGSNQLDFEGDGVTEHSELRFVNLNTSGDYFSFAHNTRTLVLSGNSAGVGDETIMTFNADGTIVSGTTGLAQNLNADLLDGAQGTTTGGSANTVPITLSNGTIDSSFIGSVDKISEEITQTAHGFAAGTVIRKFFGGEGFTLAQANSAENAESIGIVTEVPTANTFRVTYFGLENISSATSVFDVNLGYTTNGTDLGLDQGAIYFLSETEPGQITSGLPENPNSVIKPVLAALSDRKILVTHYAGSLVSEANDQFFAESLIPVGTILYLSTDNPRFDFLKCDGSLYTAVSYPELHSIISGRYYVDAEVLAGTPFTVLQISTEGGSDKNIQVGSTIRITWNNGQASTENLTVASVVPSGNILQIACTLPTTAPVGTKVRVFGTGDDFFVPDLRGRTLVGAGGSSDPQERIIGSSFGDVVDGIQLNTTATDANSFQGTVSVTPVIRARATGDAFVATGHKHDDLYVGFTVDQTDDFNDAQKRQALDNIGMSTTAPFGIRIDDDQSDAMNAADRARAIRNVGLVGGDKGLVGTTGFIDLDLVGPTFNEMSQYYVPYNLGSGEISAFPTLTDQQAINFANTGKVLSLVTGSNQVILSSVEIGNGNGLVATGDIRTTAKPIRVRDAGNSTDLITISPYDGGSTPIAALRISTDTVNNLGIKLNGGSSNDKFIEGLDSVADPTTALNVAQDGDKAANLVYVENRIDTKINNLDLVPNLSSRQRYVTGGDATIDAENVDMSGPAGQALVFLDSGGNSQPPQLNLPNLTWASNLPNGTYLVTIDGLAWVGDGTAISTGFTVQVNNFTHSSGSLGSGSPTSITRLPFSCTGIISVSEGKVNINAATNISQINKITVSRISSASST